MSSDRTGGVRRRGFLRGSVTIGAVSGCLPRRVADPAYAEAAGDTGTSTAAPPPLGSVEVSTTINGKPTARSVHPDDASLDLLRGDGLTGSKRGCGHGVCGACTVLLDGVPVASCILPATSLHARNVTTIEGIPERQGDLHPVQRAFAMEDAVQCGYCTPGFVVAAVAFFERWRREHGRARPGRDDVATALAGHLCRCAAYDAIHEAVANACAGQYDTERSETAARVDAVDKVTGAARYTVDVSLPGMLHARALRSPHAHARVTELDWAVARRMPGVAAVVSMLGDASLVRHVGQEIAVVAATDERIAQAAVEAIVVAYDVLPAVITMTDATAPGAPAVYASRGARKFAPNSNEGPLLPEPWEGNVRGPFKVLGHHRGAARRALDDALVGGGHVAGGIFTTQAQCHTVLEPHAAVAHWTDDDALEVHLSTQGVSLMAGDIAAYFDLQPSRVSVIAQHVGGALGCKSTLTSEAIAAIRLAKLARAPVRCVFDRREEIMLGGYRPEVSSELHAAVDDHGMLVGVTAGTRANSGVAVGHWIGPTLRILYPDVPKGILDFDVLTHTPPGKPFRGPGGPQALWALEQTIDDLAHARGEDPLEMRRRWDPHPVREHLYTWAASIERWRDRAPPNSDRGRYRRGIGAALGTWMAFVQPKVQVQVDAGPDGLRASLAICDIGNGTRSLIAATLAAEMDLPLRAVEVQVGDSRLVPGPLAAGSRTASSIVPACIDAARQLQRELLDAATTQRGLRDARASRVGIVHRGGTLPWRDVLKVAGPVRVVGTRSKDKGGWFLPPAVGGPAVERFVSASIQLVEVEIDIRLGRVRPTEMWGGFAVGQIRAPELARSQAIGGMLQGLSFALYEERHLDPRQGFSLTHGLEEYRVIGIGDVPRVHVHFEQRGFDRHPSRGVGLAELVTVAPAAALGNAVFDATGWRARNLPLRPDRVLGGMT